MQIIQITLILNHLIKEIKNLYYWYLFK